MNWRIFKHKKDPKPMDYLGAPISNWTMLEPDTYYRRIGDLLYVETKTGRADVSKLAPLDYHWSFKEVSLAIAEHTPEGLLKQFTLVFVLTPNKAPLTLESLAERLDRLERSQTPVAHTFQSNDVSYAHFHDGSFPGYGVQGTHNGKWTKIRLEVQGGVDQCWYPTDAVYKGQTYRIAFHK